MFSKKGFGIDYKIQSMEDKQRIQRILIEIEQDRARNKKETAAKMEIELKLSLLEKEYREALKAQEIMDGLDEEETTPPSPSETPK